MRPLLLLMVVLLAGMAPAGAQTVPPLALTPEQLSTLPQRAVVLTFGDPPVSHEFRGPLLWDVLTSSGAVDPALHADVVRQWLRVQGSDGYTAVLALGELSPAFENKPVIMAVWVDGDALDHPRVAVPGDRSPGRSTRDVTELTVESLPAPQR